MSGKELPEGWAETTLTEVADLARSTIDPQAAPDTSFNYVSLEWVASGTGAEPPPHPTLGQDIGSSKLPFRAGDVLYGKLRPYLRKVFLATRDGVSVTDLVPLRAKPGVDPSYIKHFLLSPAHDDYVAPLMKGIGMPRLGVSDLEAMPFPVAPSQEQKRIVARLDALQARSRAAREALAEVPALLETFRQSVLAAAFRGDLTAEWRAKNPDVEPASKLLERIRAERKRRWEEANPKKKYVEPEPVDDTDLPDLPAGWVWARLEEVATDFDYGTAAKSADQGRVPVLRMGNLQGGEIDWTDLKYTDDNKEIEKYALEPNTVLFNRTNSPELVGKTAIYRGERPAVFAGYLVRVALLPGVVPDLVNFNLNSLRGKLWCWSVKSDGVSQSNISAGKLKDYAIPLCPLKEQVELVALVRAQLAIIDQMTKATGASTAELNTLDQSILARAFRGELVDQDPNDEPAAALLARIAASSPPARRAPGRRTPKGT